MFKLGNRLYGSEIGYCYACLVGRTELFKRVYPFNTPWGKFYSLWFANGYKVFKNKRNVK